MGAIVRAEYVQVPHASVYKMLWPESFEGRNNKPLGKGSLGYRKKEIVFYIVTDPKPNDAQSLTASGWNTWKSFLPAYSLQILVEQ